MFDDFSEFDDPDSPSTISKAFPYGKAIGDGKGNAVLDAGSFKPTGLEGPGARPRAPTRAGRATSCWSARKRSTTGHPLFVGGPQIGYTYPGLTLEADISYPGRPGARRDRAGLRGQHPDRPRPGLRVEPHSAGSDLIDTTSRRCAAARRPSTATRAAAGRWARSTPARSRAPAASSTARPSTARSPATRRSAARRSRSRASARASARTSSGSSRSATSRPARSTRPTTFRDAMAQLAVHVQRRLRGRPRHRDVLGRAAARSATRGRPAPARPRAPASTSGGASCKASQHPYQVNPPSGVLVNWNNRPAPKWGAADDNWAYGSVQRVRMLNDGLAKRAAARPRVGHLGDERGGDPGPAQRRAHAGDHRAAEGRARPEPARGADARDPQRVAGGGLEPARPRPRRRDRRRPGPGDLGRVLPAAVRRRDAGQGPRRAGRHELRPGRRLHRRRLLVPREGPAHAQRRKVARKFNERYCGGGNRAKCAARGLEGARRRSRATRTRCAPTRPRSGSRSGPGCCRPRSATRTARAASSR